MMPNLKHSYDLQEQTQKALKAINQYERSKQPSYSIMSTTMNHFATQYNVSSGVNTVKVFEAKERVRLQLLPNTTVYYQIQISQHIQPKVIIKNVQGGPTQIFIFFEKISKQLRNAKHYFLIRNEIILKLSKKYYAESKVLFLVFQSGDELSMLTFRMDAVRKKKRLDDLRIDKSVESVDLEQLNNQNKLRRSRSSKLKSKSYKPSAIQLKQLLVSFRPEDKLKKLAEMKSVELQRKQAAKKRIQNIQIYKQKNAQAHKVVAVCKKMFNTYQELVQNQQNKKKKIIKQNSPVFYAIKFCLISSIFFNQRQKNMKRTFIIKNFERRFIKKIRAAYQRTKRIQPVQKIRQLQVFSSLSCLIGNCLNKTSERKAVTAIYQTFGKCLPGLLINLSMYQSNNYRRIIRGIQRRWRSKFQSRMKIFQNYIEQQLKIIIKSYPHLSVIEKQFRMSNKSHQICIQYQKQTASKMKDQLQIYHRKLQQNEDYRKANKQIEQYNRTALKKKQRQLLNVPKKPAFPQYRFFRDILFMKSMVRGELQVLYRKYKKKNPEKPVEKSQQKSPKKSKKQK